MDLNDSNYLENLFINEAKKALLVNRGGGDANDAFIAYLNDSLTDFVSPVDLTFIKSYAFYKTTSLKTVDLRNITSHIDTNAFQGCTSLETVLMSDSISAATPIGSYAFHGCKALRRFEYLGTGSTGSGTYIWNSCSVLEEVIIPNLTFQNATAAFGNCTALRHVDMRGNIAPSHFIACKSLKVLILRNTSVSTMSNSNAFSSSTVDSGGTGCTIYIPKVLYDQLGTGSSKDYKAATNWSKYNAYGTITWAQIEGSEYE